MSALAPENTLAAFALCADHGVPWFELDVDVLADGTVVVLHDATLDRTTTLTGPYQGMRYADLRGADAGSWFSPRFAGEPVPTLPQVVDLMNRLGLNANVELKSGPGGRADQLAAAVARDLQALDRGRAVLVSSFDPRLLGRFRRVAPQWPVACLYQRPLRAAAWIATARLLGAVAIHPGLAGLTRERVQAFRRAGLDVNVWTVNEQRTAERLFEWGATGIFTDMAHALPFEWRR